SGSPDNISWTWPSPRLCRIWGSWRASPSMTVTPLKRIRKWRTKSPSSSTRMSFSGNMPWSRSWRVNTPVPGPSSTTVSVGLGSRTLTMARAKLALLGASAPIPSGRRRYRRQNRSEEVSIRHRRASEHAVQSQQCKKPHRPQGPQLFELQPVAHHQRPDREFGPPAQHIRKSGEILFNHPAQAPLDAEMIDDDHLAADFRHSRQLVHDCGGIGHDRHDVHCRGHIEALVG